MIYYKDLKIEEIKLLCQLIEKQNDCFLTDQKNIQFFLKVLEEQILDYIESHKIQPKLVKQFKNELILEYQAKGIIPEEISLNQILGSELDQQIINLHQEPQLEQFLNDQQKIEITNPQVTSSQQKQVQCKICKNYYKNYLRLIVHQKKNHNLVQTSKDIKKKKMRVSYEIIK